ncbi:MAG: CPBP family intramembrane metalloprotease [Planctomycetes bacterium]|nr:CPBP family intramembrane metalloprotease [Planctomycetota bacterium]MBL7106413.1 CPBP family intramembrane metalloprotease [Phycisphaerae bacterium]
MKSTEENINRGVAQYFVFPQDSYLERTSRPVYAIIFLLPFMLFYELGVVFIKSDVLSQSAVLVDAFVWLQKGLGYLGFRDKMAWLAPPVVALAILAAQQITSRKKWGIWLHDLWIMAIECVWWAIPLIIFSLLLNSSTNQSQADLQHFDQKNISISSQAVDYCSAVNAQPQDIQGQEHIAKKDSSLFASIITGIGAGIYEELVFRLILICLLMIFLQNFLRFDRSASIIMAILISAALFSAHHHIDFLTGQVNSNDPFSVIKFIFRTFAGIYFAILFSVRGFGVTAGTHAFYDILAVLINHFFFTA